MKRAETMKTLGALTLACAIPCVALAQTNKCPLQATSCLGQSLSMASTSNAFVIPTNGYDTIRFQFSGLTSSGGTLTPQGSIDGITYVAGSGFTTPAGTNTATSSSDGQYLFTVSGARFVQVVVSTVGASCGSPPCTVTLSYSLYR